LSVTQKKPRCDNGAYRPFSSNDKKRLRNVILDLREGFEASWSASAADVGFF
jgi:hypothetical protein